MLLKIYAVLDKAAGFFSSVHTAQNDAVAIRSFSDAARMPDTVFNQHPEDFTLVQVGTFDDQTGQVEPCQHMMIAKAIDFVGGPVVVKETADA